MHETDARRASERLRVALEMHDFGVEVMRQNLRRRLPEASEERIRSELTRWLRAPSELRADG
jgi:hypothetical protein